MMYVVVTEDGETHEYRALGVGDAVEAYYVDVTGIDDAPLVVGAFLRGNGLVDRVSEFKR